MSAHDNAALARRIYQLFSDDKLDDALELVAEDVEAVLVPFGQTFHGRDGFTGFMQGFKGAFPDIRISVTNQVATDDQVVSERTIAKHVENILSKLHFTSRAQIAAWAVEKGLAGDGRTNH